MGLGLGLGLGLGDVYSDQVRSVACDSHGTPQHPAAPMEHPHGTHCTPRHPWLPAAPAALSACGTPPPNPSAPRTPSAQVWGVAFDPQGGRFCTVSDDMSLRLYEQKGAAA